MKKLFSAFLFAALIISCQAKINEPIKVSDQIRLNQVGYYPSSVKEFILADLSGTSFDLVDADEKVVFSGVLVDQGTWQTSGEKVMIGDFTAFDKPGTYHIIVDEKTSSYPFEIKNNIYEPALHAAIKSYYFQRASMSIEETYGGIYKRAAGHPDDACIYHPSSGKSEGTLNAPSGWYRPTRVLRNLLAWWIH